MVKTKRYKALKKSKVAPPKKGMKILISLVLVIAIVGAMGTTIALLTNERSEPKLSVARANRELLLKSPGQWDTFEEYAMDVWVPTELPAESLGDDYKNNAKVFVQRDKGGTVEMAMGIYVMEDTDGIVYDLKENISELANIITVYVNKMIGATTRGGGTSIMIDVNVTEVGGGREVLEAVGEASVMMHYRDPKDPSNEWDEPVVYPLYINVAMFYNRPVIIWGVWDWSVYEGESRTYAFVNDAAVSLLVTEGGTPKVVEPAPTTKILK